MDQQRGLVHFACDKTRYGLEGAVNALVNGDPVVEGRLLQHPVNHFGLDAWVANPEAQAPIIVGAELVMDVAQAVVTRVTAAELEFDLARHDVELVMGDQDFIGRDLEETRQGTNGLAGQVHEGLRFEQPDGVTCQAGAGHQTVEIFLHGQAGLQFSRERVDPPKPGIVAGGFVIWAGVAQADKQFDHLIGVGYQFPEA